MDADFKKYHWYYISREEYSELRKNRTRPLLSYDPHVFLEPVERYDADSFRALIGSRGEYHSKDGISSYSYYRDREEDRAGVFTADGISFYEIRNYEFPLNNRVEITLRRIREVVRATMNTAFVLMPFAEPSLKSVYQQHIKDFLKAKLQIEAHRADEFLDNDVIIDTIYSQIDRSEFIIAEISECNKNVFYELGYAAAKEKDIVMIVQTGRTPSFFDRTHIRWIEYSLNCPEALREALEGTIKSIRKKRVDLSR